jgi:hypothetical protein
MDRRWEEYEREQARREYEDRADEPGDDSNPDPSLPQYNLPPVPPLGYPEHANYHDGNGNPYWPGLADYPPDGVVYHRDSNVPYTVDPETGIPHPPEIDLADSASAQTAGSRG